MKPYLIAFDPGKTQDPAAIQVYKAEFGVVHPNSLLERKGKVIFRDNLVMQYKLSDKRHTKTAEFIVNLMKRPSLVAQTVLVFDATGVGAAVKDILWDSGVRDMLPIVYTAGGHVNYKYVEDGDERFNIGQNKAFKLKMIDQINVPKPDLVDAARLAMERQEVKLVKGLPYAEEFQRQLIEFRGVMNKKGYVSYNNSSDEIHDEWVNTFMMRSYVRSLYMAQIYELEQPWEKYEETVVGLKEIIG